MRSFLTTSFIALLLGTAQALPNRRALQLKGLLSKRAAINCATSPGYCPNNGPSGSVVSPAGGVVVSQSADPGGDGLLNFNYTGVNVFPQSGGPVLFTQNVNVSLQSTNPNQYYHLGLIGAAYSGAQFEAYFITPPGACGTFNLVVEEQQYYSQNGQTGYSIQFRSAAPQVTVNCVGSNSNNGGGDNGGNGNGGRVYTVTTTVQVTTTVSVRSSASSFSSIVPPPLTPSSSQSILTGVVLSSMSTPSILTGVELSSTPQSILTGVVQSTDTPLTGVTLQSDTAVPTATPS